MFYLFANYLLALHYHWDRMQIIMIIINVIFCPRGLYWSLTYSMLHRESLQLLLS
jgi:hypothetical protein